MCRCRVIENLSPPSRVFSTWPLFLRERHKQGSHVLRGRNLLKKIGVGRGPFACNVWVERGEGAQEPYREMGSKSNWGGNGEVFAKDSRERPFHRTLRSASKIKDFFLSLLLSLRNTVRFSQTRNIK